VREEVKMREKLLTFFTHGVMVAAREEGGVEKV